MWKKGHKFDIESCHDQAAMQSSGRAIDMGLVGLRYETTQRPDRSRDILCTLEILPRPSMQPGANAQT